LGTARPIGINLGQSRHCISRGGSRGHHNLRLRTTRTKESQKHIIILTLPGKKAGFSTVALPVLIVAEGHGRVLET